MQGFGGCKHLTYIMIQKSQGASTTQHHDIKLLPQKLILAHNTKAYSMHYIAQY